MVAESVIGWYRAVGLALSGSGSVPEPQPRDPVADARLIDGVRSDLAASADHADVAVRLIWTGEHIDAARRLQTSVANPATKAVAARIAATALPYSGWLHTAPAN